MLVTLPNADNYQVHRGLFIAAWKVWFKRFTDHPELWKEGKMPICQTNQSLSILLESGCRFSLETICRLMAPWNYRNLEMASDEFVRLNTALFKPVTYTKANGDNVNGVQLTEHANELWNELTFIAQDLYMTFAEARIQADIETTTDEPIVIDDAGIEVIGEDIYPPVLPEKKDSINEYALAMVAWIEEAPYQALYQRQPVGDAVSGWDNRLKTAYWPKPRMGYNELSHISSPLLYRAGLLAHGLDEGKQWDSEDKILAVKTANEIFLLYGVPQRDVRPENVEAVFRAAISEDIHSLAKMNSGWTHIAAFATHHLETSENRLPLIAWNSRISTAIISRLDFLLVEAGCSGPKALFKELGTIPGWGGTRPRELSLQWPSGYRKWSTQIAASRLVLLMRDILNNATDEQGNQLYPQMPLAGGDSGLWTIRGIQLVLSNDGY